MVKVCGRKSGGGAALNNFVVDGILTLKSISAQHSRGFACLNSLFCNLLNNKTFFGHFDSNTKIQFV